MSPNPLFLLLTRFYLFFLKDTGYPIFFLYDEHNTLFNFGFFLYYIQTCTHTHAHTNTHTHKHTHCRPFLFFPIGHRLPNRPPLRRAQQTLQLRIFICVAMIPNPYPAIPSYRTPAMPSFSSTTNATHSSTLDSSFNTYIHAYTRTHTNTHTHTHTGRPFPLFWTGNRLPHLPSLRRAQQTLQLWLLFRGHYGRLHLGRAAIQRLWPSPTPLLARLAIRVWTRRRSRIGRARIPRYVSLYIHTSTYTHR